MSAVLLVWMFLTQPPALVAAECRNTGAADVRTWRFEPAGARWRVVHWIGSDRANAASLLLPKADVQLTPAVVSVEARTSNGGIDIALRGTPAQATLDVYVSYELEVNVDASLTPRIDELNTEGPVSVRCDVKPAPPDV